MEPQAKRSDSDKALQERGFILEALILHRIIDGT